ncbi:MAG: hypothetical protein IKA51_06045 [Clostridia bacterium]|nr:hypothetical protein [Clostridia bacterium]
MLPKVLIDEGVSQQPHKEGDLYKEVDISGKKFRLLYGYYESFERENRFGDPIPIYPDLESSPCYTDDGTPIVTAMQNVCKHYKGKTDEDSSCSDCEFFKIGEELFGLCSCAKNRQSEKTEVKK